jgi:hypothetical protein
MGEFAKRISDGQEIKIGTCENMYYIRYEDRSKVLQLPNSLDCSEQLNLYWRLPFPDEDNIDIGNYGNYTRAYTLFDFRIEGSEQYPGRFQMHHENGLLLSVACYHGVKLPEASEDFRPAWNGCDPSAFALYSILNTKEGIRFSIKCRWCGKGWLADFQDIAEYIRDEEFKKRLEAYGVTEP